MAEAYLHHSQNDHLNLDGPFNIANVVHKYFLSVTSQKYTRNV